MLPKSLKWLRILSLVLALIVGIVPADTAAGQFDPLFDEFDARGLSSAEKRFLQAALAFQGLYNGLLDGIWGRGSQRSLERYANERFGTMPANAHMATLAFDFVRDVEREGWEIVYFDKLDMSFAFPTNRMIREDDYNNMEVWKHENADFLIAVDTDLSGYARGWHTRTLETGDPESKPYLLRTPDTWITSGRTRDGSTYYIRSDSRGTRWSTVTLLASPEDGSLMSGVVSSISVGRAPQLIVPEEGNLARMVSLFIDWANEENIVDETASPPAAAPSAPASSAPEHESTPSSGSGFYVDLTGTVLTNAHVIKGCKTLRVDGTIARLIAVSDEFDLAIIQAQPLPDSAPIARFSPRSAPLNADVTVIGYPLHGLLGGLNVTRGSVVSLTGFMGDVKTMQISAPVQSGNSGGPVVDEAGRVTGVVVSKLDALKVANISGEIPQNINFAIRGEVAKLFLGANSIDYAISDNDTTVRPTALAKEATDYTVLIECN